jgi:hypothetical protein
VLDFQIADLNLDGKLDLLLALNPPGRDSVVLSRGDGTYANPIPGPYTFNLVGVADFNSDGIPDVLTTGFYGNAPQIYYGRGDGTFDDAVPIDPCQPSTTCSLQIINVDGDDKPDLLAWDSSWGWSGNYRVVRGDGRGGFEKPMQLPDSFSDDNDQGLALTFADLNGDGTPDAIRARSWYANDGNGDNLIDLYVGQGSGKFIPAGTVRLPYRAGPVIVVDVNGDGRPDLVASDGEQSLLIFLNTSGG